MSVLLHFSEDPSIEVFVPHVAPTSIEPESFVWAVDEAHAPAYWFPRDCPRACCWSNEWRMHAIESCWLERVRRCELFVYQFDPSGFKLKIAEAGYWVARHDVRPLSVEPVGDLLTRHVEAQIELRVVNNLWPLIDAIVESGLQFSIIRKANALPRDRMSA